MTSWTWMLFNEDTFREKLLPSSYLSYHLSCWFNFIQKSEKIYASIVHKTWQNPWTHFGLLLAQKPQNKVFLDKSFGSVLITDAAATSCKNQKSFMHWILTTPEKPHFGPIPAHFWPQTFKKKFSKNILRQL